MAEPEEQARDQHVVRNPHGASQLQPSPGEDTAERAKAAGNQAFKAGDYALAVRHYTLGLEEKGAGQHSQLRISLLTNRSLAHYRLGAYEAAARDAEAALLLDSTHSKAAFRAAAASLMLGDAAAASRYMQHLRGCSAGNAGTTVPASWGVLQEHAQALLEHQQLVQEAQQQQHEQQGNQEQPRPSLQKVPTRYDAVRRLVQGLTAEAEWEGDGEDTDPAQLLQQLAAEMESTQLEASAAVQAAAAAQAAAAFAAVGPLAYRLVLFYLAAPDASYRDAAAAVLQAAGQAAAGGKRAVLWPGWVWERLLALATDLQAGNSSTVAMQLLAWAAARDAWVRQHLLVHPLPAAANKNTSPVSQVVGLLTNSGKLPFVAAVASGQLLQAYGRDADSADVLAHANCSPLLALLRAAAKAEGDGGGILGPPLEGTAGDAACAAAPGMEPASGLASGGPVSGGSSGGSSSSSSSSEGGFASREEAEAHGLEQLRSKRQQVFDERQVALRRALLAAAAELAGASRELVLAEAVVRKSSGAGSKGGGGSGGKGGAASKSGVAAGALLTEALALARDLHQQQPRRPAPMLGPDGRPKAYVKRRFAADFKDNPAGDFLLTLYLNDGGSDGSRRGNGDSTSMGGQQEQQQQQQQAGAEEQTAQHQQQPLLLLALGLLHHIATASSGTAALLYRRDLFGLCEELCSYCTPAVVTAAQRLYAAVSDRVPAALDELLLAASPCAMAALLLHSSNQRNQQQALGKLSAMVDTCSGDDFALLCGTSAAATSVARGSAVYRAWQLGGCEDKGGPAGPSAAPAVPATAGEQETLATAKQASLSFALLCLERAQRQQQLRTLAAPRGGAWDAIGRQSLLRLLRERQQQQQQLNAAGTESQEVADQKSEVFVNFKKGFLGQRPSRGQAAGQEAAAAVPTQPLSQPAGAAAAPLEAADQEDCSNSCKSAAAPLPQQAATQEAAQAEPAVSGSGAGSKPGSAAADVSTFAERQHLEQSSHQQDGAAYPRERHGQHRDVATPSAAEQQQWRQQQGCADVADLRQPGEVADVAGEDDDVADLHDVFDSGASLAAEQRRVRSEWMALPLDKKLRWTQTSLDVSVHVLMPAGTRAADVLVQVTSGSLTVSLKWYGRVLDGRLHRPVKAGEVHWCMEDNEVHVLLAKADDSWWKAVLEGGEEKSYYEILQEAVNADEPVKPYDELDDSAKGLIDAIQERQAYINAGLLDIDGFDDFRVVLGESGLGGSRRG